MQTFSESWAEAGFFQRLMIVAQVLLIVLAYFATVSGFADLMNIHLTHDLNPERAVQVLFVIAVATAVIMALLIGLHTMLDRKRRFSGRITGALAYIFFLFWSIAFGYGFFWKTFAAEDFTRGRFLADTAAIERQVADIVSKLKNVEAKASRASTTASDRADEESRPGGGGTCTNGDNRNSDGRPGPLTTARRDFAGSAAAQAALIQTSWIEPLRLEAGEISWRLRALDPASNAGLMASDPPRLGQPAAKDEDELERIRTKVSDSAAGRKDEYDLVATRANAFANEAIRLKSSIGADAKKEFERLASDMSTDQGRAENRWCEDLALAALMTEAANEIGNLPDPSPISLTFLEGAAAARYATINLARNAISEVTRLFNIELPETVGASKATPLGENDIIALYATGAIDFALLIVSILSRPPARNRSLFQRVKRLGRKEKSLMDDDVGVDVPDEAEEEDSLEKREKIHRAKLNRRKQKRRHGQEDLEEESNDLELQGKRRTVDESRRADVMTQLVEVIDDPPLVKEISRLVSNSIQRVNGRLFIAITLGDDPEENQAMKRFSNFLVVNGPRLDIRVLEPEARRDLRLIDTVSSRAVETTGRIVETVFEIEPWFGNAMLLGPEAQSKSISVEPLPSPGGTLHTTPDSGPHPGVFTPDSMTVNHDYYGSRKQGPAGRSGAQSEAEASDENAGGRKGMPNGYSEKPPRRWFGPAGGQPDKASQTRRSSAKRGRERE